MTSGRCSSVAASTGAGQLLADHRAHAPHDEGRIGDAERPAAGRGDSRVRRRTRPAVRSAPAPRPVGRCRAACRRNRADPAAPCWRTTLRSCPRRTAAECAFGPKCKSDGRTRGRGPSFSRPVLRKTVASQPSQPIHRPSGTPRLRTRPRHRLGPFDFGLSTVAHSWCPRLEVEAGPVRGRTRPSHCRRAFPFPLSFRDLAKRDRAVADGAAFVGGTVR